MNKLRSHLVGVDEGDIVLFSDFDSNGPMWAGQGPRQVRRTIRFSESYLAPPSVKVGLSMWDIANDSMSRVDISAENVTATGFDLCFKTWSDTRVARVRASWIAIGALRDEDLWEID